MRGFHLLVPTASLLASACIFVPPAPAASPGAVNSGPLQVEVRLAQADRELIERFLAQGSPLAPALEAQETPRMRRPAQRLEAVRKERRRLEQGPILHASYDSGAPLYEGVQVQTGETWERNGPWRAWYDDGQIWEQGAYAQGEEDGPWRWWYENGQPQASGAFDQGEHVGPWIFYHANGQVMAEGSYENDRPVGRWWTFHENGAVRSEGEYEAGLRTGRWLFQDERGLLDTFHSGLYAAGERIGD